MLRVSMSTKTLDPQKIALACTKFYGWKSPPATCSLHHNEMHEVFKILFEGAELYLKVYRAGIRSRKDIGSEVDFANFLSGSGLPVATALANREGHYILTFPESGSDRYGVVWKGVQGKSLKTTEIFEAEIRALAKLVAQCHSASRLKVNTFGKDRFSLAKIVTDATNSMSGSGFSQQFRETVQKAVALASTPGFCNLEADVICHGDPHFLNALSHQGSLTLIDFDLCMPAPRVYDIAVFAQSRIQFGLSTEDGETQTRWFLDEYLMHEPLSQEEITAIPQYALARALWVTSQLSWLLGMMSTDDTGLLLDRMTMMLNERVEAVNKNTGLRATD